MYEDTIHADMCILLQISCVCSDIRSMLALTMSIKAKFSISAHLTRHHDNKSAAPVALNVRRSMPEMMHKLRIVPFV